MRIKLRNGLDVPIAGRPEQRIEQGARVRTVALLGADYAGLEPRMLVREGDAVIAGDALFIDKRDPAVLYTAPGSGRVTAIHRGARRVLKSVVIELDEAIEAPAVTNLKLPSDGSAAASDEIRAALCGSGLWTAFRTRPFNRVPSSTTTPSAIFVTAIDTRPLAADPAVIVAGQEGAFATGLAVIATLTPGSVFVCTGPGWTGPVGQGDSFRHVEFDGPHPAGLPGTHMHHLHPVAAERLVWHIGYQDAIAIGRLFAEGRVEVGRVAALGGTAFDRPRLIQTRLGANLEELAAGEVLTGTESRPPRIVSGSPLDGRSAEGSEAFLGRYHLQVTALSAPPQPRFLGWLARPGAPYSFSGPFKKASGQRRLQPFSTSQNGYAGALVPTDAFDRVLPLDILPLPLLRALMVGDTDQAQALGCLELDAEDLALCSFVCPGKNDYGAALQVNLQRIEEEG